MDLSHNLKEVKKKMDIMKERRETRDKTKEQRKNARKIQLRDSIEEAEFFTILGIIKQNTFVEKAALLILFVSGHCCKSI